MLSDERWAALEPLVEACRPHAKVAPRHLRRTIGAIIWRHENGAKWRAIPAEHGPWWMAAQTFIRWSRLGVWERLLAMAQTRGVALGMAFLDGTSIRAHQKAAGGPSKKLLKRPASPTARLRRSDARGVALAPRLA
jgi:transposase